jgi:transposase
LRQRLGWARLRTQVRNRVHALLARQRDLAQPQLSDLFGTKGRAWLKQLKLKEPDHGLLQDQLAVLEVLDTQMKQLEKQIEAEHAGDETARRLQTLPGMGRILGAVAACEIEDIARFVRSEKLCAYAGLAPTTRASGGKIRHGRLLHACNHYLQWAFIEAAWVAVGCHDYFGGFYRRHRARGKGANEAITITARRMCQIAWAMLHEKRDFTAAPPTPQKLSPAAAA